MGFNNISIGVGGICLTNIFLMLRFGLVWLVKWKPQTKPNMRLSKKMIWLHL